MANSIYYRTTWFLFVFTAICIGIYPLIYTVMPSSAGLLGTKSPELLSNSIWTIFFYAHIIGGGVSLLTGWPQFSSSIRNAKMKLHRTLGKVYLVAVLLGGISGVYISFFATGGFIPGFGFFCLGILWLTTTAIAYSSILKKDLRNHEKFMILSFACTFAAVTLRIWNPILIGITGDFISAYKIVAYLCWIPNVFVALFIIKRKKL